MTTIDACSVKPGDLVLDARIWRRVHGTAHEPDRVLLHLDGLERPVTLRHCAAVHINPNERPQ